ncbi:MAG: PAS domain S-box protein [Thermodesulfobacteriota bacterium]
MRPFRLRTHFILSYTVITFLLTASITILYTNRVKEHAIASLSDYGIATTVNTAFAMLDRLIAEDYGPLQEFVRKFSSGTHVAGIEVSDPDHRILAATVTERLGATMEKEPPGRCVFDRDDICVSIDEDARLLVVTAPIVWEKISYGQVRLFLSMEDILAHIREIQRNGISIGMGVWLAAVALGIYLAERLTRPMRGFVQATEGISQGDFNVRIPEGGMVRELTAFAGALRVMAEAIGSREQALLESEKKFRHLFERALEGIFVADCHGRLLDANPAFFFVLGYPSKEALLGQNLFADIFELEAYSFFATQIEANGMVKDYELSLRKGDGSSIIASLTCNAIRDEDGTILRYEGLVRDITQQRRAEREVLRMRNYLNNIIESMPSMLVTVDEEGVITQWNSAASQMTGVAAHEAIGRRIYDIAPLFGKYQDQLAESHRTRTPVRLNREQVDKNAELVCNLTFFPLVANGTSGVAIRVDDVTELERKEQQLRQAQKMESVGTLAGGLAHDFNNVLGGIIGNLSLIQYKLDSGGLDEVQLREYLDRMSLASNRAVDMVRQLLTLSRRQEVELVPVDLNLTIKHVRKLGENTFDKSVRVTARPVEQPAYVLADPTEMEQVLLNLCINGVHAMTIMREQELWGGELTVALDRVEVDAAFQKSHPDAMPGCYWRLSVSDTGVGMEAKTVAKIFDPFFTTKEKGKGSGLGLAMVYSIVRQHNGFVDVYTEKGLGSTFSVYLPLLLRQQGDDSAGAAARPEVVRGEGTILVVDDEEFVREAAKEILEAAGYTVLVASDGREGVELFQKHRDAIRLVLLDMVMPVMSGREAFLEMRRVSPEVRVLLCSGFRQDARVEEILQLGVNDFLQKPYTLIGLTSAVKKVLVG